MQRVRHGCAFSVLYVNEPRPLQFLDEPLFVLPSLAVLAVGAWAVAYVRGGGGGAARTTKRTAGGRSTRRHLRRRRRSDEAVEELREIRDYLLDADRFRFAARLGSKSARRRQRTGERLEGITRNPDPPGGPPDDDEDVTLMSLCGATAVTPLVTG